MKLPTLLLVIALSLTGLPSRLLAATAEDDQIAGAKKEGALLLYLSTNLADANGLVQLIPCIQSSSAASPITRHI